MYKRQLLSLVLGIPLGLVMGRCKNRWPDKLGTALIVLIQAVPQKVLLKFRKNLRKWAKRSIVSSAYSERKFLTKCTASKEDLSLIHI